MGEKGEVQKGDDVTSNLDVTLEDLYNGGTRKASYNRRVVCRGCGARPNNPKCGGCGRCPNEGKVVNVQMGPFMTQQQQEVPSKEKCKHEDTTIDVHIEKGMRDGESLTFPRMAEQRPGMLPGNVIMTLKARTHHIRHLDGHIIEVGTEDVTKPFQVIKVKGEGM